MDQGRLPINQFDILIEGNTVIPGHTLDTGVGNYGVGQSEAIVAHDLGFTPVLFPFIDEGDGNFTLIPNPSIVVLNSAGYIMSWITGSVDINNIYFNLNSLGFNYASSALPSVNIKYYICQRTAN